MYIWFKNNLPRELHTYFAGCRSADHWRNVRHERLQWSGHRGQWSIFDQHFRTSVRPCTSGCRVLSGRSTRRGKRGQCRRVRTLRATFQAHLPCGRSSRKGERCELFVNWLFFLTWIQFGVSSSIFPATMTSAANAPTSSPKRRSIAFVRHSAIVHSWTCRIAHGSWTSTFWHITRQTWPTNRRRPIWVA